MRSRVTEVAKKMAATAMSRAESISGSTVRHASLQKAQAESRSVRWERRSSCSSCSCRRE